MCERGRAHANLPLADWRVEIGPEMVIEPPADQDATHRAQQRKPMGFGELREKRLPVPQLERERRPIALSVPEERGAGVAPRDDMPLGPIDRPDGLFLHVRVELEWPLRWRHRPAADLVSELIHGDANAETRWCVLLARSRPEHRRQTALLRQRARERAFRRRAEQPQRAIEVRLCRSRSDRRQR